MRASWAAHAPPPVSSSSLQHQLHGPATQQQYGDSGIVASAHGASNVPAAVPPAWAEAVLQTPRRVHAANRKREEDDILRSPRRSAPDSVVIATVADEKKAAAVAAAAASVVASGVGAPPTLAPCNPHGLPQVEHAPQQAAAAPAAYPCVPPIRSMPSPPAVVPLPVTMATATHRRSGQHAVVRGGCAGGSVSLSPRGSPRASPPPPASPRVSQAPLSARRCVASPLRRSLVPGGPSSPAITAAAAAAASGVGSLAPGSGPMQASPAPPPMGLASPPQSPPPLWRGSQVAWAAAPPPATLVQACPPQSGYTTMAHMTAVPPSPRARPGLTGLAAIAAPPPPMQSPLPAWRMAVAGLA